jgi:hypothetical protein
MLFKKHYKVKFYKGNKEDAEEYIKSQGLSRHCRISLEVIERHDNPIAALINATSRQTVSSWHDSNKREIVIYDYAAASKALWGYLQIATFEVHVTVFRSNGG